MSYRIASEKKLRKIFGSAESADGKWAKIKHLRERLANETGISVGEIKDLYSPTSSDSVESYYGKITAKLHTHMGTIRKYGAKGRERGFQEGLKHIQGGVEEGFRTERETRAGERRAYMTQHGPRPNDPLAHDPLYSGIYANMRSQIGASEEQSGQYAARKMEDVRNYLKTGQGGEDEATQRYIQWLGPLGGSPYKDSLKFAEAGMGSIDGARNNAGFGALNGPKLNLELCGPTDFYRGPKTLENFFSWQDPVNTLGRRCSKRFPLKDFGFDNAGYSAPAVGPQQDDPQSLIEMSQRQQAYLGRIQSSTAGGGAERLLNGVSLQGLGQSIKPLAGGM